MGSSMHRVLKKAPSFRIISSLNNPQSPKLAPLISPHHLISAQNELDKSRAPFLSRDSTTSTDASKYSQSLPFFPHFSFGYFLNPVCANELCRLEEEVVKEVQSDEKTIWADSVKKKRKRKMNKHKYRKLRKRLRRKT